MKLEGWPTYCGGRILTGLYNSDRRILPDGKLIHNLLDPKVHGYSKPAGVPTEFENFLYILKLLCSSDMSGRHPMPLGTLIAVTNKGQTVAASHLEKAGFTMVANTEKTTGYGYCKTWAIDFRKKLWPMLKDLPVPSCLEEYRASLAKAKASGDIITDSNQLHEGMELIFHKDSRDGTPFGRKGDSGRVVNLDQVQVRGDGAILIPIHLYRSGNSKSEKFCYAYSTDVTVVRKGTSKPEEKTSGLSFVRKLAIGEPNPVDEPVRISPITGRPVRKYTRKAV